MPTAWVCHNHHFIVGIIKCVHILHVRKKKVQFWSYMTYTPFSICLLCYFDTLCTFYFFSTMAEQIHRLNLTQGDFIYKLVDFWRKLITLDFVYSYGRKGAEHKRMSKYSGIYLEEIFKTMCHFLHICARFCLGLSHIISVNIMKLCYGYNIKEMWKSLRGVNFANYCK